MELFLNDGDYVSDGQGGFVRVEGSAEVLQRALFQLSVRRGSFPFLPDLGSDLYLLNREKASNWAMLAEQYASEALADESDLSVTGVELTEDETGSASLKVYMDWLGEALEGEVNI